MQLKRLSLALGAVLSFSVFANNDYQIEMGAGVAQLDELDVYELGATYYLAPVDTSRGPLAEANFLDRQTSISAVYQRFDFPGGEDTDGFLAGEYVMGNVFINALISDADINSVGAGFYLSDTWLFDANIQVDDDFDYLGARVGTKKLLSLAGDTYLALSADYNHIDDGDDIYAVAGEYYLTRNFSIGLGVQLYDDITNFDDNAIEVNTNYFISPSVSVGAGVTFIDRHDQTEELYQIGVSARF